MKNYLVLIGILFLSFSSAHAERTPSARYFAGQVKVGVNNPTPCYVEVLYSSNLTEIQTRSISTLQHLSPSGELIWIGVGPYTASFISPKNVYRYQDPTPGAFVKDLVVNISDQLTPVKYAILFWHAEAGHHDPVVCDGLVEKSSTQDLQEIDQVFERFNELKP